MRCLIAIGMEVCFCRILPLIWGCAEPARKLETEEERRSVLNTSKVATVGSPPVSQVPLMLVRRRPDLEW